MTTNPTHDQTPTMTNTNTAMNTANNTAMNNTATANTTTKAAARERLESALRLQGHHLFQLKSGSPKHDAQQNLCGRSHYVDDDTLTFFKSRILTTFRASSGLLFALVESVGSKPEDPARNKRPVIFDVFGDTLDMPAGQEWHRTTDQAAKAAREFIASFDAEKHTREKLRSQCADQIDRAKKTLAALKGKL